MGSSAYPSGFYEYKRPSDYKEVEKIKYNDLQKLKNKKPKPDLGILNFIYKIGDIWTKKN